MFFRKQMVLAAAVLLCLAGWAQEKTAEKKDTAGKTAQKDSQQVPAQTGETEKQNITAAGNGFAPNSGKEAVIDRIKALFTQSNKPIVSTKKYVPKEPYMKITEVPATETTPARAIIVYRCRFVSAEKLEDSIETALGDGGTIEVSPAQNTLVLNVLADRAEAMKKTLLDLDAPMPQVLVETQIIELVVQSGETKDVKMSYLHQDGKTGAVSTYGYNLQSGSTKSDTSGFDFFPISSEATDGTLDKFNLMMNWIENSEEAKILAAPNVIADLGTEASMETGQDLPYTENSVTQSAVTQSIKFKRTGVQLTIKPTIINPDTVQLEIKPQVTIAVSYENFAVPNTSSESKSDVTNRIPVVSVRNISTRLTAADGEIIMLGGLYSSETSDGKNKTPFLADIPLIGQFFTARNYSVNDKQLLFLMKIHILDSPYMVLTDPEQTAAQINDSAKDIRESKVIFRKPQVPGMDPGVVDAAEKNVRERFEKVMEKQKPEGTVPVTEKNAGKQE